MGGQQEIEQCWKMVLARRFSLLAHYERFEIFLRTLLCQEGDDIRHFIDALTGQARQADPVLFSFVEVSFGRMKDEAEHDYLNRIGTSFHLKDEEVDRLISAGGQILRESPDFKEFLQTNRMRQ